VIYDLSPADLVEQLVGWGVINPDARRAVSADS
jgi:hypothetical protein